MVKTCRENQSHLKHGPDVLKRVGPDHCPRHLAVRSTQNCPDSLRLEEGWEVCVGHLWLGKVPTGLRCWGLSPGAIKPIWGNPVQHLIKEGLQKKTRKSNRIIFSIHHPPSFLNADSVQIQNLPTWPPGASFNRFKLSTWNINALTRDTRSFNPILFWPNLVEPTIFSPEVSFYIGKYPRTCM